MAIPGVLKRSNFWIGLIVVLVAFWVAQDLLLDFILDDKMKAARPPQDLKTIEDFRAWKQAAISGEGTFEDSGVTYTVLLAPPGRRMPSGPSAYLFNEQGRFVDWTPDMGDYHTVEKRFDLTSGHVKFKAVEGK